MCENYIGRNPTSMSGIQADIRIYTFQETALLNARKNCRLICFSIISMVNNG